MLHDFDITFQHLLSCGLLSLELMLNKAGVQLFLVWTG